MVFKHMNAISYFGPLSCCPYILGNSPPVPYRGRVCRRAPLKNYKIVIPQNLSIILLSNPQIIFLRCKTVLFPAFNWILWFHFPISGSFSHPISLLMLLALWKQINYYLTSLFKNWDVTIMTSKSLILPWISALILQHIIYHEKN